MSSSAGSQVEGRRLAWNSVLLGGGDILAMALGFATTLVVTDRLGEAYGTFIGAQRFVGLFLVVADFGLTPLLVRSIAARRDRAGALFGTVLFLRIGLCLAFAGLVAGSAEVGNYLPEHRQVVYAFVALNVLAMFAATFTALFEGLESMGRSALVNLARALATLSGVVAVVALGGGLQEMVAVYVGAAALQLLTAFALVRGLPQPVQPTVSRERIAPFLLEAPLFVAIGLSFTAVRSLDVVLLSRLSTTEQVAQYGAAINFVDVMLIVPLLVQRVLLPAFSRLDASGAAGSVTRDALHVFSAVLVPSAVGLGLLAESIVALYPSGEFADAAPVLRLLAVSLVFLGPSSVCATYLTGVGRLWLVLSAYGLALPLQVGACALLIPTMGATGAAVATLAAHASLALVLLGIVRGLGVAVPWLAFLRHGLAALGMGAVVWLLRDALLPVPVAAGILVYVVLILVLSGAQSLERRLLAAALERWR